MLKFIIFSNYLNGMLQLVFNFEAHKRIFDYSIRDFSTDFIDYRGFEDAGAAQISQQYHQKPKQSATLHQFNVTALCFSHMWGHFLASVITIHTSGWLVPANVGSSGSLSSVSPWRMCVSSPGCCMSSGAEWLSGSSI